LAAENEKTLKEMVDSKRLLSFVVWC